MAAQPEPATRTLSSSQLNLLEEHGEVLTAEAGERLYDIGQQPERFIAILEGEASIRDGAGHEIVRHGNSGFLGELNLLSGQTIFLTATAETPMRYIAVDREELRTLLFKDGALSDLLLNTFVERRELLQNVDGVGIEIFGARSSPETRRLVQFARNLKVPYQLDPNDGDAQHPASGELPFVRLPGGRELCNPSNGELSRALGIGVELAPREEVDLLILGAGPAGLGGAVYGASEGLDTLVVESSVLGGQAGTSRLIENYLGFPAGISGSELTTRATTQARKFGARFASPYRVQSLTPDGDRHIVVVNGGSVDASSEIHARAVLLATGAEYRRLPVEGLEAYEGESIFYAAGPLEGRKCGGHRAAVVGGGNSAGQAAVWLAKGGTLVTLLHRRDDLHETMSSYLIDEVEHAGVEVRDRSEIAQLHGPDGQLEAVTLTDGTKLDFSYLFLFLGAAPCTKWLGDCIARDSKGFVLTGPDAGAEGLLETSVPGVYAAGDVRSGSLKRCAIAVAEGATVVRFVHQRRSAVPAG
jgi:thioredoxin reductase (NADPH)